MSDGKKFINNVSDEICEAEASLTMQRLRALGDDYKVRSRRSWASTTSCLRWPARVRTRISTSSSMSSTALPGSPLGPCFRKLPQCPGRLGLSSGRRVDETSARFIVLDDVTSSFDAGHQFRLMEQIRQRLQYRGGDEVLQFIVLSHDELLEKYFDKVAHEGGWHHQRLQGLPPLGAVTVVGQDAQRLRSTAAGFLSAGQVNAAVPLLRQYLELSLLRVVERFVSPCPSTSPFGMTARWCRTCSMRSWPRSSCMRRSVTSILTQAQVDDLKKRHVTSLDGSNWVSHYSTGSTSSRAQRYCSGAQHHRRTRRLLQMGRHVNDPALPPLVQNLTSRT